ncbi:MAG: multi-sensor hybrid histidine kinase [Deferribacteraceae bacterium]|nr:multi-sensor hybrid histidine kinase [Deferribacteraceae bacterium]
MTIKNKVIITFLIFLTLVTSSFAQKIKVGFWENKPLSYDENDGYKGFIVDIFKYIAKKENIDYEMKKGSWSQLYSDISNGNIDVFFPIGFAEYRLQYMNFSRYPLFENWGQIITTRDKKIKSFYDLQGKTIAVQFNDIFLMATNGLGLVLDRLNIDVKYYFVDNYEEAVDAVINKGVDCALVARNYTFAIVSENITTTPIIVKPIKTHFAYSKNLNEDIINKIDNAIKSLLEDENSYYYKRLKYFSEGMYLHNPILHFIEENYIFVSLTILLIFTLTVIIIHTFKKKLYLATIEVKNERKKIVKILNNLSDPVILFNHKGIVEFLNIAAKNTFDILDFGKSVADCQYQIEDRNKNIIKFEEFFSSESLENYYTIKNTRKGDIIAEISITKVKNENTNDNDYIVMINNITKAIQNIEIQTKIDKLETVGKIAAGIAHDFNNYLGAMSNYIIAVKSKGIITEEIQKVENLIFKSKHLTRQLLTFAKGSSLEIKNTDINKLVKEAAEFALKGSSTSLNFDINQPETQGSLCADVDENYITQVITNIVLNASQAMNNKGEIDISTSIEFFAEKNEYNLSKGEYIKIAIRDYGSGIPEDIKNEIFEPFFTTKETGSGLGLAISHSIIKKHSGYITFKNLDKGCVFEIFLPKTECKLNKISETKDEIDIKKLKILYMDDEADLRDSFKMILEILDCNVTVTKNGEETLKEVENKKFDIIVLDLTIKGGMNGEETIKMLKEKGIDSYFVVSSGYSDSDIITEYKKHGFDFYLPKPFAVEDLKMMLAQASIRV